MPYAPTLSHTQHNTRTHTHTHTQRQAAEADEEMILLTIIKMNGRRCFFNVPLRATFGHIKRKYIQPVVDISAGQIRLIYEGQLLDDNKTPMDYNILEGTSVILIRSGVPASRS